MLYKRLFPIAIFLILIGFLWKSMLLNPKLKFNTNNIKTTYFSVPDFYLSTIEDENNKVSQEIFKDKLSIVNIWASWCGSCVKEHKYLLELSEKHKDLQFIGINFNDRRVDAQKVLRIIGNPYRYNLFDKYGTLSIKLGILGTPETYIVDKKGIIKYKYSGPINEEIWQNIILREINKIKKG